MFFLLIVTLRADVSLELRSIFDVIKNRNDFDYEKKINLAEQAKKISHENKDMESWLHSNNMLAKLNYQSGNPQNSLEILQESIVIADSLQILGMLAEAYLVKSQTYTSKVDYLKGYENILIALKLYEEIQDYKGLILSYIVIAQIFYYMEDYDRSLEYSGKVEALSILHSEEFYYVRSLQDQAKIFILIQEYDRAAALYKICSEKKYVDSALHARTLMQVSRLKYLTGNLDEGIDFARKALEMSNEMNDLHLSGNITTNIAYIYKLKKDFENSLKYNLQALELRRSVLSKAIECSSLRNIGVLCLDFQKYEQSQHYFTMALSLADTLNNQQIEVDIYKHLARLHEELNDPREALRFANKYSALKEGLDNYLIGAKMIDLQKKSEISKKVIEYEILHRDNLITEMLLEKQKNFTKAVIVAGALFLIIIILLLHLFHFKKKYAKLLEQEVADRTIDLREEIIERKKVEEEIMTLLQEKTTLLEEVNHRVRNNMQLITSIMGLQKKLIEDPIIEGIFDKTYKRIFALSLINADFYNSENLSGVILKDYVEMLALVLFRDSGIDSKIVKMNLDLQDTKLSIKYAIPCALIINELITNVLKHAFPNGRKGYFNIVLRSVKEDVYLEVSDNGIGITDDIYAKMDMYETVGMVLLNALTIQLKGDLKFQRENGTKVSVSFKLEKQQTINDGIIKLNSRIDKINSEVVLE